jgi:hypothetical protein
MPNLAGNPKHIKARKEKFRPGDVVDHINGWEGVSATDLPVIERIDDKTFPDDPVAFFVGGGFWRTSRLRVVTSQDAPPFDSPEVG